ncbi:MAG: inositol monophosphatase [Acidobacteria bacterium]|nr:inositol monophosphatase [Acidobacteriota bacterium]
MTDIDQFIQVGTEAAREAGALILERFNTDFTIAQKGAINLVTEVDLAAEELIVGRIRKAFPTHAILAEERYSDVRKDAICWIIDPLDGTTNFTHGYRVFSVSIGLEMDGEVEWGCVLDPVRNELYVARRGKGAFCNGALISVSKMESLDASLLATGFPYDIRTSKQTNLENYCAFALRSQGVRRSGSAALDLCNVAAGRLDGFWESKLNPWDCAAGYLMVREAGGKVTNYRGLPGSIYDREVIASNKLIHDQMLAVLDTTARKIEDSRLEIRD